ncbi:MAG TPA: ABC transporter ATP-binding protein [Acidimicrobiia bacterium]|nr:ABC transporter ATP-binding protein [Acidimicrobiia bacterium]
MTATVEAQGLSKWFGPKVAVSEVNLSFEPGVTGLLGPNGAGKTTLLRLLTGLQVPSQGEVRLMGVDPRRDHRIYRQVAMVPEDEAIYANLTAREFVAMSARLTGGRGQMEAVSEAISAVGLVDDQDRRLRGFSKGMRQRTKVAAALVGRPQILVLDEPLNGADPVQRAHLIALFKRLGDEGVTVIVSSHVLAEVERTVNRVIAMVDGRLAAEGTVASLRAAMTDKPRLVRITTDAPRPLAALLVKEAGMDGVRIDGQSVEVSTSDPTALAHLLPVASREAGIRLSEVRSADESLESVFRYLVRER